MKKKVIPILLMYMLIYASTIYAFSDVDEHWAKDSIEELGKINIVKGYEDESFKPDNYMTRAEVATVINRLIGITSEASNYIPDINRQDWYYTEIRKAVKAGFMKGDTLGYTRPNSLVTREEAITMLSRAFYISKPTMLTGKYNDENEISDWSKEYVTAFIDFEYIKGYEDGKIHPKSYITRAEFVTILNRIFKEIAVNGIYEENINGNLLVIGNNIALNNLTVNGDLIIAEGVSKTLKLKNVTVKGNLVLREELNSNQFDVYGKRINAYEQADLKLNKYTNKEYGIEFSISDVVTVVEKWNEENIDYKKKNLLLIDIEQLDEYYLKGIKTIGKSKIREVDTIYNFAESGNIGNAFYILYDDISNGENYKFLVIKRDNIVYTLLFSNITADNLVDNVLSTIKLYEGEKTLDRKKVIYKNDKLNVKFSYREDYIGIDDSYNTNNVYSGDAVMKLFIQVNTITDIEDYSFKQVQNLLKSLIAKDGDLLETDTLKIINNNAVKFKVLTPENKIMYSLYIIIGNNLYDFIFTADEEVMNEVGDYFFDEIINSLEI